MFLDNKYAHWYNLIIANAQKRILESYGENHHIIPKSIGGNNDKENLVKLTPREHYVCHLLLTKMVTGKPKQKMMFAYWAMSNQCNEKRKDREYKVNSRLYESLRVKIVSMLSEQKKTQIAWHKGKKIRDHYTDEHMEKNRQNIVTLNKKRAGRKLSEETKQKIREKRALQVMTTKGRKHTPEAIQKIKEKRALQTNVKNQYSKP